jgi:hypothetical protein
VGKKLLLLVACLVWPAAAAAQITPTYTYVAGTVINPDEVNANFALLQNALNRTGGTMTGTLTAQAIAFAANNTYAVGSSGTRASNVFSVLGNFSGAVTFGSTIGVTGVATLATLALTTLSCTGCVTSANVLNDEIVNADINSAAGIVDTKLATISTAGKVSNSATTATSANTASAIVARDGSGNFSAGAITATFAGGFRVLDVDGDASLILKPGSNFSVNRTISLAIGDADRTLTMSGDATISGTNTGDQTITLTSDVTGSGTGSFATTLATVNSNVGSFGSSTSIPTFTVNAKGLITAASGNVVIAPAGTLTGTTLASNVVTTSATTVGTLNAGAISSGFGAIDIGSDAITAGAGNYSGVHTVSSFGEHKFTSSGTGGGGQFVTVENTNSANGAHIGFRLMTDAGIVGTLGSESTNSAAGAPYLPNAVYLQSESANGLSYVSTHASGAHRWYSGGLTERMRLHASGGLSLGDTTDPGATNFRVAGTSTLVGAVTAPTLDTGQGANELYDMDQNVLTTSSPTFDTVTAGVLKVTSTSIPSGLGIYANSSSKFGFAYNSGLLMTLDRDATQARLTIPSRDGNGLTGVGPGIVIGRDSHGSAPVAGWLVLTGADGTAYYLWVDATGDLRISTAPPDVDGSPSDTSGAVVGGQS